ncbi:hypothetical protein [Mycobacterium sp. 852002-40037_SCH5390672]|uniref:hypothetical protein n=1 Tax=Mycobacterium sp. 852002-40037_SCH5390672 TaxID=1834089 RepID=UPI000805D73B|nr:hypothetical protein [Mycobacterium sp. 852002-40037_SCH5390672]OBB95722.1 hypothetical protein A5782_05940 [Mycobacterium sp. 852002-40037_SCH5390672]
MSVEQAHAEQPQAGQARYRGVPQEDASLVQAADRWLVTGAVLTGSLIFSPIGLVVIAIGFIKTAKAKGSGAFVRPAAVTLFGMFAMVDAAANFLGWSLDVWAHDSRIVQWAFTGWGRLVDGAYYLDYNHLWAGGAAAAGEKSWEFFCILGLFPARLAAAYGFIKLKRWGYRWMIITSWAYIMVWMGYIVNMVVNFPERFGSSVFGVTGWWVFDIWYMTPFLTLPWLYALDRRRWSRL